MFEAVKDLIESMREELAIERGEKYIKPADKPKKPIMPSHPYPKRPLKPKKKKQKQCYCLACVNYNYFFCKAKSITLDNGYAMRCHSRQCIFYKKKRKVLAVKKNG